MLTIQINNDELEQDILQTYGNNMQSITDAFAQFIKQQRIKNDVIISKKQAINGDVVELDKVINDICAKYHAS
jgi:hypothetical protein